MRIRRHLALRLRPGQALVCCQPRRHRGRDTPPGRGPAREADDAAPIPCPVPPGPPRRGGHPRRSRFGRRGAAGPTARERYRRVRHAVPGDRQCDLVHRSWPALRRVRPAAGQPRQPELPRAERAEFAGCLQRPAAADISGERERDRHVRQRPQLRALGMDGDQGDDYIIGPTTGTGTGGTQYEIQVTDASGNLVNNGEIYSFTCPRGAPPGAPPRTRRSLTPPAAAGDHPAHHPAHHPPGRRVRHQVPRRAHHPARPAARRQPAAAPSPRRSSHHGRAAIRSSSP
jgi:hypothetical protein